MADSVLQLAKNFLSLGDIDSAEAAVLGAPDPHAGGTGELWQLRLVRAQILNLRGRVEEAVRCLESCPQPDPEQIEACAALKMYIGGFLGSLGQYERSHRLLDDAAEAARGAGLPKLWAEALLRRAFVFFLQRDYSSSAGLFREVLDECDRLDGWYFRGNALWGVGKNLMIQGRHLDAIPWLENSLQIFEAAGARLAIAMVWSELAVCHLGLGDDEKAMALLRDAEVVNREAGYIHNYQVNLANIGNVYLHRGDHFTAISYYRRALELARQIKDPVSVKKWTRNTNLAYARIRLAVDQRNPRAAGPSLDPAILNS